MGMPWEPWKKHPPGGYLGDYEENTLLASFGNRDDDFFAYDVEFRFILTSYIE